MRQPPHSGSGAAADLVTRGTVIDERFLVEAVIGAGAFGVVYRAVDYSLGQVVALKMVKPTGADRRTLIQRFAREARISSALQHPNTARLVHFGQWRVRDGERPLPYMALELVRGFPLSALVKHRGRLTPDEASWVALGILESLGEAHELGILHRDLKPDNVMVVAPEATWRNLQDSGPFHARLGIPPLEDPVWADLRGLHVKVVDFGLGKLMPGGGAAFDVLTATGIVAGTAQYMSPEQVTGSKDLDGRADLYALAALLYRVLTGAPLFDGEDDLTVALKHVTEALPELPPPLDQHPIAAVYRRAGAKDRADRFATASEMAWALRAVPVGWTPPPPEPPPAETPGLLGRLLGKLRS